jgi:hypothetical protein
MDDNESERYVASELLECPGCNKLVHTAPAEKVPAQALRVCLECEEVFFMDLSKDPVYPWTPASKR